MDVGRERRGVKRSGRLILALVPDLMIAVRIEEAAKTLGARVETVGSMEEATGRLRSQGIDTVVVDLAMAELEMGEITRAAREAGASVISFHPHVEVALRRAALRAGIEHVYARSRFLKELPVILRERQEA